ncbi:CHAT domain-containing protein [Vibrio natriegens]|uniref:CHAT domain-containing protein n=1 Tax=Vibrio natriegens TaxID=691 RepID=UPI001EFC8768|nr:CHAT domain-containing protein [Vibrio natriegens]MCG9699492.1 CHAT domain-containing protein [Vibrio natriegens]
MAMVDTYRRSVARKRDEISRLTEQKAKEHAKITGFNNKIQAATRQMNSSKSATMINSRLKDIQRNQENIAKVEKKIAEFEAKIAKKNKELQAEQRKLSTEELKEAKKLQQQQTKFQREQVKAFSAVNRTLSEHSDAINSLNELPEEITVLFLASNPRDQGQLGLDEEVRSIKEMIAKSRHRDVVKLESCWAVRPGDILQYINEYQPTIVHFSGHGSSNDELVLMDNNSNTKLVSMESIVQAMSVANEDLRLVFFNTCHSKNQASNVTEYIECAIGMNTSISDNAAQVFSAQFYSSLGFGLSVEKSFNQAKAALMLEGIPEENTPALFVKSGCDAAGICIVAE